MNAPKPKESLAGQTCPCCQQGHFALVQIDYTEPVADDNPITVSGVWVERCDHCGETVFPGETTRFIESAVAEQTEQLTPRELERIREDLGVDTQDEMSESLGLGLKSYHKWESGKQFPTRSMSYYIRVLAEFPQAFDWLRRRAWRQKNRLAQFQSEPSQADFVLMFPDLPQRYLAIECKPSPQETPPTSGRLGTPGQKRPNPALGLTRVAFVTK
jgi:putative zinc finger/helix-turn-helix YgiT family protein